MNEQNNLNNSGTQTPQTETVTKTTTEAQTADPTPVAQLATEAAPVAQATPATQETAPAPAAQEVAPALAAQPAAEAAPAAQEATPAPATQPAAEAAPATQEATPAPAAQPAAEAAPATQEATPAPAAQPAAEAAPVTQEATPAPAAQPAAEAAPAVQEATPAPAAQPATEAAPAAQEVAPAPAAQPAAEAAPVTQEVAPTPAAQPAAEAAPVTQEAAPSTSTDIVAKEAINPLANEQTQATVTVTNNAVITPSTPLVPNQPNGGAIDSSNVGFVAVSEGPKKKKNKVLIFSIVAVVLIALGLLGYFIIYPFVVNKFFSDPRKVYETVIRTAFNDLNTSVTQTIHDKSIYDVQFSFDSNIPTIQEYGGYTYGITLGADPKNEKAEIKFASINRDNQRTSYESYLKDGKHYLKYHNRTNYIYTGEANLEEVDSLFGLFSFSDILSLSSNVNAEDTSYLINKFADLLIGSLDNSKISKEEASLNVNGQTLKVYNNKYQIDKTVAEATVKYIINGIIEDDKALDILAKMLETESTKLKETLKTLIEEDEEENTEEEDSEEENIVYTFSIYTTIGIKPDVIGFGLKNSKDESTAHYYAVDDYFEIKVYSITKDAETNKKIENYLDVIGKTSNGKTKVSVLLNEKEIVNLNIKDWSDNTKNLEYAVTLDEGSTITGILKLTHKLTDNNIKNSLEFSLEMGEQFIAVVVDYSQDWNKEVANIAADNAVTLSDDQINELHNSFLMDLYDTPIGELFQTVSGDVTPEINDYYDNSSNMMEDPVDQTLPNDVNGEIVQIQ